tara:strand:- start:301 stop:483 length:183 start_codon:yes stop_codon:yes gene_type:complete
MVSNQSIMSFDFDWFTIYWLMENLHWFILVLVISMIILFFFPIILGYDLKKRADDFEEKE